MLVLCSSPTFYVSLCCGQGFSFLSIPRSYYGVLSIERLISGASLSEDLAQRVWSVCEEANIISADGAVSLEVSLLDLDRLFQSHTFLVEEQKHPIFETILTSRYCNLYNLLQDKITNDEYVGIVRNQILVDVQGSDILFQIFTCNVLQRGQRDEAPFFEFIQRRCSTTRTNDGSASKIKPGCGGFG